QMTDTDIRVTTNWMARLYRPIIAWTIKSRGTRWTTAVVALGVFVGSVALVPALKVNLLGDTGMNMHAVTYTAPQGSTLQRTSELSRELEEELAEVEQVDTVQADIGGGMMGSGPDQVSFTLITDPGADQTEVATNIQATWDAYFEDHPEAGENQLEAGGGIMRSDTAAIQLEALYEADLSEATQTFSATLEDLDDGARVESEFEATA